MPLLLPNLDDRKWNDLVDEGRSLIPVYGPEWSDHNVSDPGIMLTELLAFIAEMDIFQLNQISDRERLKFLRLVNIVPHGPAPARSVLRLTLEGALSLPLPATLEFMAKDPSGPTYYRTLQPITAVPGSLDVMQFHCGSSFENLTPTWKRRSAINPFGENPSPGCEFYLGFSDPLPVDTDIHLFLTSGIASSSESERHRILQEIAAQEKDCRPAPNPCLNGKAQSLCAKTSSSTKHNSLPPHYGVRLIWEFASKASGTLQWLELTGAAIKDHTRSLTLDGAVILHMPNEMAAIRVGRVSDPKYYIRARLVAGAYDAAPALQDVAFNGVPVEQTVPYGMAFMINSGANIHYSSSGAPKRGQLALIKMALDEKRKVISLDFNGDERTDPKFLIYDFNEPKNGAAGMLAFEAAFLGFGDDSPNLQLAIPSAPVQVSSFELFSQEGNQWNRWRLRHDFDSSTRKDLHAVLDAERGTITFGNGEKGRVPSSLQSARNPQQFLIFAKYRTTRAEAGNLGANAINCLADSPHNKALFYNPEANADKWETTRPQLKCIANPLAAEGGQAAETVDLASARAVQSVQVSDGAVTLLDYERLAKETPGTRIARVSARGNLHPSFPCFKAPGLVTVIVLPSLPKGRPMPTPGLLRTVASYLRRRRIIGTRVEVVAPTYLGISVQAEVKALPGTNQGNIQKAVVSALNKFLDPLEGGPDGKGWPFGRDVYRSEIMRVIHQVPGVDYVSSLSLSGPDGQPQCGNICLRPTWLVSAGNHQISVLSQNATPRKTQP